MINKVLGKLNSKKGIENKFPAEEYSVHAIKFLLDNNMFKIESFK